MWEVINETTGTMRTCQGDSGSFTVSGLPTDKNYYLYFSVYDENRKAMFPSEPYVQTNGADSVVFVVTAGLTDLLVVPLDEDYKTYYYGLKVCDPDTGTEDTLPVGNGDVSTLNELIVYPKKTEGTV